MTRGPVYACGIVMALAVLTACPVAHWQSFGPVETVEVDLTGGASSTWWVEARLEPGSSRAIDCTLVAVQVSMLLPAGGGILTVDVVDANEDLLATHLLRAHREVDSTAEWFTVPGSSVWLPDGDACVGFMELTLSSELGLSGMADIVVSAVNQTDRIPRYLHATILTTTLTPST